MKLSVRYGFSLLALLLLLLPVYQIATVVSRSHHSADSCTRRASHQAVLRPIGFIRRLEPSPDSPHTKSASSPGGYTSCGFADGRRNRRIALGLAGE